MTEQPDVEAAVARAVEDAEMRYVIQGTSETEGGYGPPFGPPWQLVDAATSEPEVNWPGRLIAEADDLKTLKAERHRPIVRAALAAADQARCRPAADAPEEWKDGRDLLGAWVHPLLSSRYLALYGGATRGVSG
jgi:hypothetical protein